MQKSNTKGPWHWQVTALRGTLHGGPAGTTHVMACDAEDLPKGADARLIEAAPDLLTVLRDCRRFLSMCHDPSDELNNSTMKAIGKAIMKADAAIAKAEGNTE